MRVFIVILLVSQGVSFGGEKELFGLPSPADELWERYTDTFFPEISSGSAEFHFVNHLPAKDRVQCLSILNERGDDQNRFYLVARALDESGAIQGEAKRVEISVRT
ncbi:MAG: hypothetical protein AAF357_00130, partial [Verrucomicrobiota bacterium]